MKIPQLIYQRSKSRAKHSGPIWNCQRDVEHSGTFTECQDEQTQAWLNLELIQDTCVSQGMNLLGSVKIF